MAKIKFKPFSLKGTHKEPMTEKEKKNFGLVKYLNTGVVHVKSYTRRRPKK